MRLDLTEYWQFAQHPSYFETENSVIKIFYIVQKVIPIVGFVGHRPRIISNLRGRGALAQQDAQFFPKYTK